MSGEKELDAFPFDLITIQIGGRGKDSLIGGETISNCATSRRSDSGSPGVANSFLHLCRDIRIAVHETLLARVLWRLSVFCLGLLPLISLPAPGAQFPHLRFQRVIPNEAESWGNVSKFYQDSIGFLWAATSEGLKRYDGRSIITFAHIRGDSTSLSDSWVNNICVDSGKNFWLATNGGGLDCFDRMTGTFSHLRHDPDNPNSIASDYVYASYVDPDGVIWISTGRGFDRYDQRSRTFEHHLQEFWPGVPRTVWDVAEPDRNGILWVATSGDGLYKFDRRSRVILAHYLHNPSDPYSIRSNSVASMQKDSRGVHWLLLREGGGEEQFDTSTGRCRHFLHDSKDPYSFPGANGGYILEDSHGTEWFGCEDGGIAIYDPLTKRFHSYTHDPADPVSLADNDCGRIFEDRSGLLWASSRDGSVYKWFPSGDPFHLYRCDELDPASLNSSFIWSIMADHRGIVWVCTDEGLDLLDRSTDKAHHISPAASGLPARALRAIRAIAEEPSRTNCWLGTLAGLVRYSFSDGRFTLLDRYFNQFGECHIFSILFDTSTHRGHLLLWLAVQHSGLFSFDATTHSVTKYIPDSTSPGGNDVRSLYEDPTGILWVGTTGGLYRFEKFTGKFTGYHPDPKNPGSISDDYVLCSTMDSSGVLWLATSDGFDRFDTRTGLSMAYYRADGLADDLVYAVVPDAAGNLWLSTNSGISEFNPGTRVFKNYAETDGVQGREFNSGSWFRSSTGEIYFGGTNGLNIFSPADFRPPSPAPSVVFTSIRIDGEELFSAPEMERLRVLDLGDDRNFFTVEASVLDFTAPEMNKLAFRLEEFDKNWVPIGSRRSLRYTNVPPGRYTLRIVGANSDGVWNNEGAALTVVIHAAFWRTLWFRILLAVAFGTLLYGGYRWRLARLLEVDRMRLRIARDLHDEVGSNLSAIGMAGSLLSGKNSFETGDLDRLRRMTELAILTNSEIREIVWFINPEHDSGEQLIMKMKEAAGLLLCGMEYNFTVSAEDSSMDKLDILNRRNIFLIFKEALNNIVRHSSATKVTIALRVREGFLLKISDNGRGFVRDARKTGNGHGLDSLAHRAARLRGTLEVQSSPGQGTSVTLEAKIPRSRYGV